VAGAVSERKARAMLERRAPDPIVLHTYLSVLADAIVEIHRLEPSQWAVTLAGAVPRLMVGHYITYSAFDLARGVWLALDQESFRQLMARGAPAGFLKAWKSDGAGRDEYAHYKDREHRVISTNGYFTLVSVDTAGWAVVERLSFRFLANVLDPYVGQGMQKKSRAHHEPGLLALIRKELRREIPEPAY